MSIVETSLTAKQNQYHGTSPAASLDYFALLKPKVMSLVVFTAFAGMWVAPGFSTLHPVLAAIAILCVAINAGAAGAINMWYDRDIDAVMNRTKDRPIPRGRVNPEEALGFGVILSLFSVMVMGLAINWGAAVLLACANLFYVFIYTIWLKRRTAQNIVIGGAAGAFPPAIGWIAAGGDITHPMPWLLFALIFLWTPPHFWALALFANDDYRRADIPMLPNVAGERATKIQMLGYTLTLLPLSILPSVLGYASLAYGMTAALLSALFILSCAQTFRDCAAYKAAKRMFGYSVFYLFAIFLALMLL